MRIGRPFRSLVVSLTAVLLGLGCCGCDTAQSSGSGQDGAICCPRDAEPSGCMNLGGAEGDGGCVETCDFWCSTSWRVETVAGCEQWVYDTRSPEPGENELCLVEGE